MSLLSRGVLDVLRAVFKVLVLEAWIVLLCD
jgi:hypothetical protein